MLIRVPGSTANIGPGFDCMALAVNRYFELSDTELDGFTPVPEDDLVWAALAPTGAEYDRLWFRTDISRGRGLGSSAAACVAGAYLGFRSTGIDAVDARDAAFAVCTDIEEHPDNAAASAYGGLNLAVGGHIETSVPQVESGTLFIWLPTLITLTKESRTRLMAQISRDDVVSHTAACAAVYAGLLTGSWPLIQGANGDRLHEEPRFIAMPESGAVARQLRAEGHAAWLSGSGPGIAALIESGGREVVPVSDGDWVALDVDIDGCVEID